MTQRSCNSTSWGLQAFHPQVQPQHIPCVVIQRTNRKVVCENFKSEHLELMAGVHTSKSLGVRYVPERCMPNPRGASGMTLLYVSTAPSPAPKSFSPWTVNFDPEMCKMRPYPRTGVPTSSTAFRGEFRRISKHPMH